MCRWFCWNLFYCLDTKKKLWIGKASCRSDGSYRARLLPIAGSKHSMWPADGIKSVYTLAEKHCAIYLKFQHMPDTHTGNPINVLEPHNSSNKTYFSTKETADVYSCTDRQMIRSHLYHNIWQPLLRRWGNIACTQCARFWYSNWNEY